MSNFTPEQLALGRKWVDALRSGKYQQGRAFLRRDNKFCCLGIACDIYNPQGWDANGIYLGQMSGLPEEVGSAFGVSSILGKLQSRVEWNGKSSGTLAFLNDAGMPFSEIADVIEREIYKGQLPPSEVAE